MFTRKGSLITNFRTVDSKENIQGDSFIKIFKLKDKMIRLWINDTYGDLYFLPADFPILKNTACIIFFYDITVKSSFASIPGYLEYYKNKKEFNQSELKILVGDIHSGERIRMVTEEEGIEFAKKNDMLFFETSVKEGTNVNEVFMQSARIILDRINKGEINLKDRSCGIKENKRVGKDKKNYKICNCHIF